eukprot:365214-Chlamydomonas_euryale.AAC.8
MSHLRDQHQQQCRPPVAEERAGSDAQPGHPVHDDDEDARQEAVHGQVRQRPRHVVRAQSVHAALALLDHLRSHGARTFEMEPAMP